MFDTGLITKKKKNKTTPTELPVGQSCVRKCDAQWVPPAAVPGRTTLNSALCYCDLHTTQVVPWYVNDVLFQVQQDAEERDRQGRLRTKLRSLIFVRGDGPRGYRISPSQPREDSRVGGGRRREAGHHHPERSLTLARRRAVGAGLRGGRGRCRLFLRPRLPDTQR